MPQTDRVVQAAKAAIQRAKHRHSDEVSPDDLLVALLRQAGRFGVALIGDWAIDVTALDDVPADARVEGGRGPAYAPATIRLFERAAALAREDGAQATALVHLLAAYAGEEDGLMGRLRRAYVFDSAGWRAALARTEPLFPDRPERPAAGGDGFDRGTSMGGADLLSVDQAAEVLSVHAQTVRNYIRSGKLPAYRLAGERFIRVLRKDLLALLEPVSPEDAELPG